MREKSMQNLLGHSAAWRGRGLKVRHPLRLSVNCGAHASRQATQNPAKQMCTPAALITYILQIRLAPTALQDVDAPGRTDPDEDADDPGEGVHRLGGFCWV